MKDLELQEGEEIIDTIKGSYWENTFIFLYEQSVGDIVITNKRLLFNAKVLASNFIALDIKISDIAEIQKCNVATVVPLNPTGIKLIDHYGNTCKISAVRREKVMETLQQLIDKNKDGNVR